VLSEFSDGGSSDEYVESGIREFLEDLDAIPSIESVSRDRLTQDEIHVPFPCASLHQSRSSRDPQRSS